MAEKYNHKRIESKWQEVWEKTKINRTDLTSEKPKFYNLIMFPYPSGDYLHLGHGYSNSGADVYGRYKALNGFNIFMPIGYDSFGLPAENFAIKKGIHPRKSVSQNIEHAQKQLKTWGCMFDFSREVTTSEPNYYKWTQWLFLKLYEQGLAYQKESPVNWCPKCMTVLANEQVKDGFCERCEAEVVQKNMKQWFFKITDYADRLIKDLDKVDWPESSVTKQRNWIGRSEGVQMDMPVADSKEKLSVFTTRIDTVYGMTYVVLAPEHPLVDKVTTADQKKEVEKYKIQAQKQTEIERQSLEKEKTGVFTGSYAINPFNGEKVPIWIADYVLFGYGTGAVMAVPAHDERDFEFAKKYDLPIIQSIAPVFVDPTNPPKDGIEDTVRHGVIVLVKHWSEDKYLLDYSPKFGWKCLFCGGVEDGEDPLEAAAREIREEAGYQNIKEVRYMPLHHIDRFHAPHKGVNRYAHQKNIYIELADGEYVEPTEEEKELHQVSWHTKEEMLEQITLVNHKYIFETELMSGQAWTGYGALVDSAEFTGLLSEEAKKKMAEWLEKKKAGETKVNYRLHDWSIGRQRYWGAPIPIIYCEKCGVVPVPEKDLPVELPEKIKDFRPKGTGKGPLASVKEFVETTCPKCGGKAERETDTMDTFVDSSFYYLRYPSVGNDSEMMEKKVIEKWLPVDMYVGGAEHVTMHLLYARFIAKALYDAKLLKFDEPFLKLRHQGMILGPDGKKMSKSKGNVVIPDAVIKEHGTDIFRTYILFMGRFEDGGPWDPKGIVGIKRFLEKYWSLANLISAENFDLDQSVDGSQDMIVKKTINKAIKKVGEDIESFKFNTAISSLMECVNALNFLEMKYKPKQSIELWKNTVEKLTIILSPFAPHMTEEIWESLGNTESVHLQSWPKYDKDLIKDETVTVAVQINGKVREQLLINVEAEEKEVLELAKASKKVQNYLQGKEIKKVIYIKGKLLSLVVS
ncbi:MAG: class I tRNA ligase family protein [bacterium]|nr:class I tRNA ligase family protein [bacterium]